MKKSEAMNIDHSLRFHTPDLQTQAAENFQRMERSGVGLAEFRDVAVKFGQAVEWHQMINVMDVVITDVAREPRHQRIGFQIAG